MLTEKIQLPGGFELFKFLLDQNKPRGNNALIVGSNCELVALRLADLFSNVFIISDDYGPVLQYKLKFNSDESIKVKMMDYAHTDFNDNYFDLIFAQGSISVYERKNILKEFKRILTTEGIICVGEIVSLIEPVPAFVKDIWERSNLEPILSSAIKSFYESKGFNVMCEQDHSSTLKEYYENALQEVSTTSKEEKDNNKKYFSRIKHEADAYLKHGGNKYIGFKSLIVRKAN